MWNDYCLLQHLDLLLLIFDSLNSCQKIVATIGPSIFYLLWCLLIMLAICSAQVWLTFPLFIFEFFYKKIKIGGQFICPLSPFVLVTQPPHVLYVTEILCCNKISPPGRLRGYERVWSELHCWIHSGPPREWEPMEIPSRSLQRQYSVLGEWSSSIFSVFEGFKCQEQLCICSEHAFGSSLPWSPAKSRCQRCCGGSGGIGHWSIRFWLGKNSLFYLGTSGPY